MFVDSWAWIALADRSDAGHQIAKETYQQHFKSCKPFVTTDYVLSEVITYLYQTLPTMQAEAFIEAIMQGIEQGTYLFHHVNELEFRRAWEWRLKYDDKPDISFVDLTSMVIMQELKIVDVFTGDYHFSQVNLGFSLHPERTS